MRQSKPADTLRTYQVQVSASLASRIEALCERYPHKRRTELLVDLLNLGLDQVQHLWPHAVAGDAQLEPEAGQVVYLPTGPFDEFHGLAPKHHDTWLASSAQAPDDGASAPPVAPSGLPFNP